MSDPGEAPSPAAPSDTRDDAGDRSGRPRDTTRGKTLAWRSVEIFTLTSFTVAQPLFAVLGENATFFVAHAITGADLVLFALLVTLVPALALVVVDVLATLVGRRVGTVVHASLLGALLALFIGPHVERSLGLTGLISILLLLVLASLSTLLFLRSAVAIRLVRYAWFAPFLFVGLLLFASQASTLLGETADARELEGAAPDVPVVWIVFDQFPLAFLVDDDGDLLVDRYPNFARLAAISTWYPVTSSISTSTGVSMPSMLSGRPATGDALPTISAYPDNVFTLLGQVLDVNADEYVTQMCPDSVCRSTDEAADRGSTVSDVWAVMVRTMLAEDVADRFVPPVNDRWNDFGGDTVISSGFVTDEAETVDDIRRQRLAEEDDRVRFGRILDGVTADTPGELHYIHLFQPHEPLRFLPDGRSYDRARSFVPDDTGRWPESEPMTDQMLQAYVLQAMHADREVGRMLDRLSETGLLDDALIVVTSDHGVSLAPGTLNRVYTPETADDLLPVPLFIKAPGQMQPRVDERLAQQHDLLPTVLDLLGIPTTGLGIEGESLVGPERPGPPELIIDGRIVELPTVPAAERSRTVEWIRSLMPVQQRPYVFGEHGNLVGQPVSDLSVGDSDLVANIPMASQFEQVGVNGPNVPANVYGTIDGSDESVHLAVSIGGTISGVGASFEFAGEWNIAVMIDPEYLVEGANDFAVYEITDDGLLSVATS